MANIATLTSSPTYSEASQIIPTINGVINQINANALIGTQAPTSLRNAVIGGDFGTNPWQRGTSPSAISNTLTYTADRFWALGGASSSITITQQTASQYPGFNGSLRFSRTAANADTTAIKLGYVMADNDPAQFQGRPFVLSFYAKAGANFSSASNVLGITVGYGTAANGSAANFAAGSWTGYAGVTLTGSAGTTVTGVTLTTSWARYVVAGFIPTTANQIGFSMQYTPVGTAGAADFFEITGVQFEVMPQGGVNPTPFEYLPQGLVRSLCQRYFYQFNEGATTVANLMGQCTTTTVAQINVTLPVTMRSAPTGAATVGTFTVAKADGTAQALTTLALTASSATVQNFRLTATASAANLVAGNATQLLGGGGSGNVTASAEL